MEYCMEKLSDSNCHEDLKSKLGLMMTQFLEKTRLPTEGSTEIADLMEQLKQIVVSQFE